MIMPRLASWSETEIPMSEPSQAVAAPAVVPPSTVVPSKVGFEDVDKKLFYSYGTLLFGSTSFFATPFLLLKRRLQMGMDLSVFQLVKREGITGSFRGGSLWWISGCNRMMYFTIYEKALKTFESLNGRVHIPGYVPSQKMKDSVSSGSAAAIASIASQAVLTPVAVVTTRLHVNQGPLLSARGVMHSIVSQHGRWGVLWTGEYCYLPCWFLSRFLR